MSDQNVVDARQLRITFNDDTVQTYAFEPLQVDVSNIAGAVQKFFEQGFFNLELEEKVILIPISSIKSFEIEPKPDVSLPNSIRIIHQFEE